jgi:hypothetical protein
MPTLNIDGQRIKIDDGFLKLSPEEQNATVDEIARSLGGGGQPAAATAPAESVAPPVSPPQGRGILETVDDYVRAAANGMTLGLADRFAAKMGAVTGVGGQSGDYAGNLQSERERTERFYNEHPIAGIGANIAGGIVVPMGAVGAAARGSSLLTKSLYGMGAGAGLGGAQGAFSSSDLTDIPQTTRKAIIGAELGGVIGGAIPGAGRLIGAGYNVAANAVRGGAEGMSRGASKHLVDALMADTPASVQARLSQLGPDAMLADAGPAFLGKAQGASLNSDEGRSILQGALTTRNAETNARIMDGVNRALGPAEDPQTVTNAIRAHRSDVDGQAYPAAFQNAGPVDTSNVLAELGPMIGRSVGMEQRALTNLREMLMMHGPNGRVVPQSNAEVLHKIKGELDNVIEYDAPGLGLPAAALSRQQGALRHMRGLVNEALERQVPGYMEANRQSAGLARRAEAVELGTQYLGNGKTTASPARFEHEFTQLTPGEQIAFAKGSRGEIERKLGTKANDLQALRSELQGEGGWNTDKLATVHGRESAEDLINSVERNLAFRDTHNKVVENSQTAQRLSAKEAMKPSPASDPALINPNATVAGMGLTGIKKALGLVYHAVKPSETRAFGEIAEILSSQGPARDARLQSLMEALDKRRVNAATAPAAGDRAALIAAIAAHGYARTNPRRSRE